jgi:hypothetical protein
MNKELEALAVAVLAWNVGVGGGTMLNQWHVLPDRAMPDFEPIRLALSDSPAAVNSAPDYLEREQLKGLLLTVALSE